MAKKGIDKNLAKNYFEYVSNIKPDQTIKTIISYLEKSGFGSQFYKFEPTLARSFSYSEGPIWEIVIEDYKVGSVGGGERYDGMMKRLTGLDIPATGIAFGFDRTVEAADELGLIEIPNTRTLCLMTIFSEELLGKSLEIATILRDNNINTEIYPNPNTKLEKQLKYADKKQIPFVVIIGQDEVDKNLVTLKNLLTKEQRQVTINEVCKLLQEQHHSLRESKPIS
jgi:histidyl-tRNA synthetase